MTPSSNAAAATTNSPRAPTRPAPTPTATGPSVIAALRHAWTYPFALSRWSCTTRFGSAAEIAGRIGDAHSVASVITTVSQRMLGADDEHGEHRRRAECGERRDALAVEAVGERAADHGARGLGAGDDRHHDRDGDGRVRLLVGVQAGAEEGDRLAQRSEAREEADQAYGCVYGEHATWSRLKRRHGPPSSRRTPSESAVFLRNVSERGRVSRASTRASRRSAISISSGSPTVMRTETDRRSRPSGLTMSAEPLQRGGDRGAVADGDRDEVRDRRQRLQPELDEAREQALAPGAGLGGPSRDLASLADARPGGVLGGLAHVEGVLDLVQRRGDVQRASRPSRRAARRGRRSSRTCAARPRGGPASEVLAQPSG